MRKKEWKIVTEERGSIQKACCGENEIIFRNDEYEGPALYVQRTNGIKRVELLREKDGVERFSGKVENVDFFLSYTKEEALKINIEIINNGETPFTPDRVFVRLGLDFYMESYPQWDNVYFPTLLRCEKNYFWGYVQKTNGDILAISCDRPIKSWKLDYNRVNDEHIGHRIYTCEIDLISMYPQPDRHPQDLQMLKKGEKIQRTICLWDCETEVNVGKYLFEKTKLPFLEVKRYTMEVGEKNFVEVYSCEPFSLQVFYKDELVESRTGVCTEKVVEIPFGPYQDKGIYTLILKTTDGKEACAEVFVREKYSWYLNAARKAAWDMPQKATTHLEGWNGFFSAFLAARYFPNKELDLKLQKHFDKVLANMYDIENAEPLTDPGRVCNTAVAAGMFVKAWEATEEKKYIDLAMRLGDWLMENQDKDGSYRAYAHMDGLGYPVTGKEKGLHYTAVFYIGKSMLELISAEEKAAKKYETEKRRFSEAVKRHYKSAEKAMHELMINLDNINTEGEITFEDGMISCSCSQLALFALLQKNEELRRKYTEAAIYMQKKHRCLEQRQVPDCRRRGGTLRFWEAQYDILADSNLMCSPHGWTAWNVYGLWYLYLLTGEKEYLEQTMDTVGAGMQLINLEDGKLRWAFLNDPCIITGLWKENPHKKGTGMRVQTVVGEEYLDMISGWYRVKNDKPVGAFLSRALITNEGPKVSDNIGGCCDNDVHENFKAMAEVALNKAYIIIRNGNAETWNCHAELNEHIWRIVPSEKVVEFIHINSDGSNSFEIKFNEANLLITDITGMQWIGKDGPVSEKSVVNGVA